MISNKDCWLKNKCNHVDCGGFCLRLFKLDYLYESALMSLAQRKYTDLYLDKDFTDEKEFTLLSNLCNNVCDFVSNGDNLYLHSSRCGNGKTSFALRFIQTYFNKIWYSADLSCKALFISVPRLMIELKSNIESKSEYVEHIKSNILKADIVIWDDIASKQSTVFESENLFSMIDARIASGKSNIFTSNLSNDELHKFLGDRLASRITNSKYNVELHGLDKRKIVR